MTYRNVALLPMKANSSRVKGKNFRMFRSKPLFSWILETLLSVEDIDLVVINTDAREMLAHHGCVDTDRILIRDRKPSLCGDSVSMNLIIADDVSSVQSESYLMTHTTNPLLRSETIANALSRYSNGLLNGSCDSLFTVGRVQTRFYRADCSPVNHDPSLLVPTQDLEPWFEENSNLYIFSSSSFAASSARIGLNPAMYETPPLESLDIDTPSDWDLAVFAAEYLDNLKPQ